MGGLRIFLQGEAFQLLKEMDDYREFGFMYRHEGVSAYISNTVNKTIDSFFFKSSSFSRHYLRRDYSK